jgi:two-component system, chemotaxis family, chemotaxis protein CheY
MQPIENDRKKRGTGKTVLVVDDNAAIRKMLTTAFLSDGFKKCEEADNGKECIELARQIKPDLIVLDLSMPVMNGLEAATELRKLFPNLPMILFTVYDTSSLLEEQASRAGINLVLSKSVKLSTLINEAHKLIA